MGHRTTQSRAYTSLDYISLVHGGRRYSEGIDGRSHSEIHSVGCTEVLRDEVGM